MLSNPNTPTNNAGIVKNQMIPLLLTVAIFFGLTAVFAGVILGLNLIPHTQPIVLKLRWYDVLIGATIYLKTSVDFAIFMGRLMTANPGWKNRIAIEIGTALGNGLGTILVLIIWTFFKEVEWLLAIMIFLAALVLFELAFASLEHFNNWEGEGGIKRLLFLGLNKPLSILIKLTQPLTAKILPDLGEKLKGNTNLTWKKLLYFSFTVPFILGLDDFAGYVPLFNVVNVFGFSLGVIGAHMLLNIALFINPSLTVKLVKNAWVSFAGAVAFVALAIWGLVEVVKIFLH
jgi:hypothetical protein